MLVLHRDDPVTVALVEAIHTGDLAVLGRLLGEQQGLASARIEDNAGRSVTPLHAATDWPGHFPNGAAVVTALIEAGADPNAPVVGFGHAETALHWAASSDDVEVADALLDAGACIEAPGASIAGGSPLDDAVGYGQWQVARRLVERGARVSKLWHAAALGMMSRVEEYFATTTRPAPEDVNEAFWQACHGGQRRAAEYLLARGADLNSLPGYADKTALDIVTAVGSRRQALASWLREQGIRSADEPR
ncbi:MAG: ankyrin repeat domain-containing protein [Dehalococcoidia bacterium]